MIKLNIIKREFGKMIMLLNTFCLVYSSYAQEKKNETNFSNKESFICATGIYSFKVVNGKVLVVNSELPDINKFQVNAIVPSDLEKFNNVKTISSGENHLMLLTQDGKVFTWGSNTSGQLGNKEYKLDDNFHQVKGLPKIKEVSAGKFHCLALDFKGNVYSWGNNLVGQLGDGSTINRFTPKKIEGLKNILSIDAGMHHNLALDKKGMVWAWGHNKNGELGDGTVENKFTPVQVKNLNNVISVKASVVSMALKSDETLWTWGYNGFGQLCNDSFENSNVPQQISSLPPIKSMECGAGHSVALDHEGFIWSWGRNHKGQLGDGSTEDRNFPSKIASDCISLSAGNYHNLFLKSDYSIWLSGNSSKNLIRNDDKEEEVGEVYLLDNLIYSESDVEVIILTE